MSPKFLLCDKNGVSLKPSLKSAHQEIDLSAKLIITPNHSLSIYYMPRTGVVILKVCPQILGYFSRKEVELNPSCCVWVGLCDSSLANKIQQK